MAAFTRAEYFKTIETHPMTNIMAKRAKKYPILVKNNLILFITLFVFLIFLIHFTKFIIQMMNESSKPKIINPTIRMITIIMKTYAIEPKDFILDLEITNAYKIQTINKEIMIGNNVRLCRNIFLKNL